MGKFAGGLIALLLLLVAGCGGSATESSEAAESPSPEPTTASPTPEPPKLELADACPRIQDALDDSFKGDKLFYPGRDFVGFADRIGELREQVDSNGEPLLRVLEEASRETGALIDDDPFAEQLWLTAMSHVTDTCEELGAPLR